MVNEIEIRVGDDTEAEIGRLARKTGLDTDEVVRRLIKLGLEDAEQLGVTFLDDADASAEEAQ